MICARNPFRSPPRHRSPPTVAKPHPSPATTAPAAGSLPFDVASRRPPHAANLVRTRLRHRRPLLNLNKTNPNSPTPIPSPPPAVHAIALSSYAPPFPSCSFRFFRCVCSLPLNPSPIPIPLFFFNPQFLPNAADGPCRVCCRIRALSSTPSPCDTAALCSLTPVAVARTSPQSDASAPDVSTCPSSRRPTLTASLARTRLCHHRPSPSSFNDATVAPHRVFFCIRAPPLNPDLRTTTT